MKSKNGKMKIWEFVLQLLVCCGVGREIGPIKYLQPFIRN